MAALLIWKTTVKGKNGKSKKAWIKVKVVKPTVKKPVTKKPTTTKPSKPAVKPVEPKPEEPSIPSKPEVDWKTCSHDWGVGCKHQEVRTICHGCLMDYEDIEHHMDVEMDKDMFTMCAGYGTYLTGFYECSKCGAGKKHIPDWDNPTAGRDFIFETYAECLQFTPY